MHYDHFLHNLSTMALMGELYLTGKEFIASHVVLFVSLGLVYMINYWGLTLLYREEPWGFNPYWFIDPVQEKAFKMYTKIYDAVTYDPLRFDIPVIQFLCILR